MDQYAIYLRKSRDDDDVHGDAVERHRKALLELAAARGYQIAEIYNEDVMSGDSIRERPEMRRLLHDVEAGVYRGVLVMEVPRLARGDTVDQGVVARTFRYSDTQIITPARIYDTIEETDEEYLEFELFMSRREYKMINRRQQAGRLASVKEGKFCGQKAPYGYRKIKLEHAKGWSLEIVPEEAAIVRMIFEWYTAGVDGERLGTTKIARRLNEMGVPKRESREWTAATLRDMLQNPTYIGKIRWNWRPTQKAVSEGKIVSTRRRNDEPLLVDGIHEPIITQQLYDDARFCREKNPARPIGRRLVVQNPLSGLIVCGICGRKMVRRPYPEGGTPDTLLCTGINCDNVSSYISIVEDHLLSGIHDWLLEYKLQWQLPTAPEDYGNRRQAESALLTEIQALRDQMERVYDLLERGIYDLATYNQRGDAVKGKLAAAEAHLTALREQAAATERRRTEAALLIPKAEHLLAVYNQLPDARAKNDLLREVIEKAVYTKTKNCRWHNDPHDFDLAIYPRFFN